MAAPNVIGRLHITGVHQKTPASFCFFFLNKILYNPRSRGDFFFLNNIEFFHLPMNIKKPVRKFSRFKRKVLRVGKTVPKVSMSHLYT